MVRRICATIRRCGTVAPKLDFSGSTRNNRVRAEKCTSTWCERRLGLAAETRTVNLSSVWGPISHAFCYIQRLTGSSSKRTGTISAGSACVWPTMVFGPAYFCDNSALPYRSAQTRLFGVHKEQQGASREKYAPVVRTAARIHRESKSLASAVPPYRRLMLPYG